MMKTVVIIFAGMQSVHPFDQVFAGESAFERVVSWASARTGTVVVFTIPENKALVDAQSSGRCTIIEKQKWSDGDIAESISTVCSSFTADAALYVWGDCPFLNTAITDEIMRTHTDYFAEYTFADGYPYGFSPELIDAGAAAILSRLAASAEASSLQPDRDGLFSIMKADINSFEIETVLAPKDYRLLRLQFECSTKAGLTACRHIFESVPDKLNDAVALSEYSRQTAAVLQTVPSFYNVQIAGSCRGSCDFCPFSADKKPYPVQNMPFDHFKQFVKEAAVLSETAVISLSAWGEPLLHPVFADFVREVLSYPDLTVFIETDGTLVSPECIEKLAGLDVSRIVWVVSLDAVDADMYAQLHVRPASDFEKAVHAVSLLEEKFPHRVYPQFVRMKQNEASLESFYRFWKEKTNPSAGDLIIQKYNNFCGVLPDEKSADLSPLVRNVCWHLRRDMTILSDGSVPQCFSAGIDDYTGNVFNESLESVWNRFRLLLEEHLHENYSQLCKSCDEYYTFNF
jgi:spiro-SPASM protein